MALPIQSFKLQHVGKPNVGEHKPSEVRAEVQVTLSSFQRGAIRDEWEELKLHDVLFLVTVRAPGASRESAAGAGGKPIPAGLKAVREKCVLLPETRFSWCTAHVFFGVV
jgi:intron-binding protein aquarius